MDDDLLLGSLEVQVALGVEFAEVAGAEPAFAGRHRLQLASLPVTGGHVFAADQNLAALVELDFFAGKDLANRTAAQAERMVDADERGGLSQSVALDDDEAQPPPELFGFGVESCTARNQRPELPSEAAVNLAEAPPAAGAGVLGRGLPMRPGPLPCGTPTKSRVPAFLP